MFSMLLEKLVVFWLEIYFYIKLRAQSQFHVDIVCHLSDAMHQKFCQPCLVRRHRPLPMGEAWSCD